MGPCTDRDREPVNAPYSSQPMGFWQRLQFWKRIKLAPVKNWTQLRSGLAVLYKTASKLACEVDDTRKDWQERLAKATQDAARPALNVVLIGAEGHGKSSLVNALLQQEICPTDRIHPGTVAPVFFEAGTSKEPVFLVERETDATTLTCTDKAEFARFLLQRHNPENRERVRCGRVRLNHALLIEGVSLVDLPGVEGVSQTVNESAMRFLKEEADVLLAVVRDRGFGPLHRMLEIRGVQPKKLYAIVANQDESAWNETPSPELGEWMDTVRAAVAQHVANGGNVCKEKIFVLHLPSCIGTERRTVKTALHSDEERRLRNEIKKLLQGSAGAQRLKCLAEPLKQVVNEMAMSVQEWGKLARETVAENDTTLQKICARFAAFRIECDVAIEDWRGKEVQDLLEMQWQMVQSRLREQRRIMTTVLNEVQRTWSGDVSDKLLNQGHLTLQHQVESFNRAANENTRVVAEHVHLRVSEWLSTIAARAARVGPLGMPMSGGPLSSPDSTLNYGICRFPQMPHPDKSSTTFLECFSNGRRAKRMINALQNANGAVDTSVQGQAHKACEAIVLDILNEHFRNFITQLSAAEEMHRHPKEHTAQVACGLRHLGKIEKHMGQCLKLYEKWEDELNCK